MDMEHIYDLEKKMNNSLDIAKDYKEQIIKFLKENDYNGLRFYYQKQKDRINIYNPVNGKRKSTSAGIDLEKLFSLCDSVLGDDN